jgi:hypothetical protein
MGDAMTDSEFWAGLEAHRATISHFEIVDKQTGKVVATAKTRAGARRAVDRRDNAWGGYRYISRTVYKNGTSI